VRQVQKGLREFKVLKESKALKARLVRKDPKA
jgi:hypothetical protein